MIIEISFSLEIEAPHGMDDLYTWYILDNPEALEVGIDLIVNASPGDPGRYSGKWEDCYPEEPTTFEPDSESYEEAKEKITKHLDLFYSWILSTYSERSFDIMRIDSYNNLDKFINSDEFDELSDEAYSSSFG